MFETILTCKDGTLLLIITSILFCFCMLQMFKLLNKRFMFYHYLTCRSLVLLPAVRIPHETKATEVTCLVQLVIGNRK